MIIDADMLFTLSLFALEPVRGIERFEWRNFNDLELCATVTLWKAIGDAMEISYAPLPSREWRDGLHWLEEIREWSMEYAKTNMKPAESNSTLCNGLIHSFYPECPNVLVPYVRQVVAFILGEQTRIAMGLPSPSPVVSDI